MDGLLVLVVWLAGSTVGKLGDPLAWLLMLVTAAAGWIRWPWWAFPAAAIIASALNVAVAYSWWAKVGVAHAWVRHSAAILAAHLVLAGAAYALGRLASRLRPAAFHPRTPQLRSRPD